MSPQGVNKVSSANAATIRPTTTKTFNDLKSEDFFGLLIAQLQSQDPLKPTDNQTLLNQMSSIRQMEQSSTLTKTLSNLASEQRFGATSSLIGQYVLGDVTDANGNKVTLGGVVTSVRFEADGRALLDLHDGRVIPADKVNLVTRVENLPQELQDQILGQTGGSNDTENPTTPTTPPGEDPGARRIPTTAQSYFTPQDGLINGVMQTLFGTGGTAGISL